MAHRFINQNTRYNIWSEWYKYLKNWIFIHCLLIFLYLQIVLKTILFSVDTYIIITWSLTIKRGSGKFEVWKKKADKFSWVSCKMIKYGFQRWLADAVFCNSQSISDRFFKISISLINQIKKKKLYNQSRPSCLLTCSVLRAQRCRQLRDLPRMVAAVKRSLALTNYNLDYKKQLSCTRQLTNYTKIPNTNLAAKICVVRFNLRQQNFKSDRKIKPEWYSQ